MISLNERAWLRLEQAVEESNGINISVQQMDCGSKLLDAGINAAGGLEAGLAMAEIGSASLLVVRLEHAPLLGVPWVWVAVHSDHPYEACFLSQAAHWNVQIGDFHAMGSGPGCLLNRDLFPAESSEVSERSDCAVLVLETRQAPDDLICCMLAEACGISPERLALIIAPTASLAGSVQIAARSLETGLHKLNHLGFDLRKIASGAGRCPIAALIGDDLTALGRTNDLMMFSSQVWLALCDVTDEQLASLTEQLPASTSTGYGLPFLEALRQAGGFYQLDPGLFAPAEATLVNLDSGMVQHMGKIDVSRLERTLKGFFPYAR